MNTIFDVEKINKNNVYKLKELYNDCKAKSFTDYKFELELLDFDGFVLNVKNGMLQGFFASEHDKPKAFLLYTESVSAATEINIIHCDLKYEARALKEILIKTFLAYLGHDKDKKNISYPMMGIQSDFVPEMSEHGFKFVQQGVLRFKFNNNESMKIFQNSNLKITDDNYSLKSWNDNYLNEASTIIFEEFSKAQDSKFDERFLSFDGAKSIVEAITSGLYGEFLPEATKLLFFKNKCIGVCLINLTIDTMANVPLIAVASSYKNTGQGVYMLKNAIQDLLKGLNAHELSITEINATADTENLAAIKMYQKLGFQLDFEYPCHI